MIQIYDNNIIRDVLTKRYKYTNAYNALNQNNISVWMEGDVVIVLEKKYQFSEVFYYSNDLNWANNLQKINWAQEPKVLNIVQREIEAPLIMGKPPYKIFKRLRKSGSSLYNNVETCFCNINDFEELIDIMNTTFDPLVDHIPVGDELKKIINEGSVICIRDKKEIKGFIIFEDKMKTSYIRMVCVNKRNVGMGIGSRLMEMYFKIHSEFVGFTLWVDIQNKAADALYRKFGYCEDKMYNLIYVF